MVRGTLKGRWFHHSGPPQSLQRQSDRHSVLQRHPYGRAGFACAPLLHIPVHTKMPALTYRTAQPLSSTAPLSQSEIAAIDLIPKSIGLGQEIGQEFVQALA